MISVLNPKIKLIEEHLNQLSFPKHPDNLYEPIRYFLSLGGKRMRPILLLLGNELFDGKYEKVLPQALAIELFHNFTLIHDDIMDRAELRRGKETVHTKWNQHVGILSGDAMLVYAYQLLAKCEEKYFIKIHQLFNQVALEVCEGQQYDMDFENKLISIDEYLEMIRLKTSVLLGTSLEMGAVLAGANEKDAKKLYLFGEHLGMAFQLQDDLLDAFGDPEKFGKKQGGDILANKKTYLLLCALRDANQEQKEKLMHFLFTTDVSNKEKIENVIHIYNSLSVKEKTQEEMNKHFELAKLSLDEIPVSNEKKETLLQLAESLMIRVS